MSVHEFVSELRSSGENSKYYPMNVIDIQLQVGVSWVFVLVSFLNSLIRSYSVLKFFACFRQFTRFPRWSLTCRWATLLTNQHTCQMNHTLVRHVTIYSFHKTAARRRGTKISQRLQCFTLSSEARRSSSWLNPQLEMSGYFSAGVIQNPMSGMVTLFFQLVGSSEFILFVIILCFVSAQHSSVVSRS